MYKNLFFFNLLYLSRRKINSYSRLNLNGKQKHLIIVSIIKCNPFKRNNVVFISCFKTADQNLDHTL